MLHLPALSLTWLHNTLCANAVALQIHYEGAEYVNSACLNSGAFYKGNPVPAGAPAPSAGLALCAALILLEMARWFEQQIAGCDFCVGREQRKVVCCPVSETELAGSHVRHVKRPQLHTQRTKRLHLL